MTAPSPAAAQPGATLDRAEVVRVLAAEIAYYRSERDGVRPGEDIPCDAHYRTVGNILEQLGDKLGLTAALQSALAGGKGGKP